MPIPRSAPEDGHRTGGAAGPVQLRGSLSFWYRATLLGQHRDRQEGTGGCGVRYYVGPGQQYQRVPPAADCRAVDDPPPSWTDRAHERTRPAQRVTASGTGTRAKETV